MIMVYMQISDNLHDGIMDTAGWRAEIKEKIVYLLII